MKNSKFLYFTKRTTFDSLVSSFPAWLSPLCFIEDTNEIWFNGHSFQAGHDSLRVAEIDNSVIVSLADSSFRIIPGSSNIQLQTQNNNIIISSNALTRIDTDNWLEWKDNILHHKDSEVKAGGYGPAADQTGVRAFTVPRIVVDSKGHIANANDRTIAIRDWVEQRKSDNQNQNRSILIAEDSRDADDTNTTRKGKNLTYNNFDQTLRVPNLEVNGGKEASVVINSGNLIVRNGTIVGKLQGEVTGTATPKIHLSDIPDFGGASTALYGHVRLLDEMPLIPSPSSSNTDKNNKQVEAIAASPYLVYNYVRAQKIKVNAIDANKQSVDISNRIDFTDDFVVHGNQLSINWIEL